VRNPQGNCIWNRHLARPHDHWKSEAV